jgi:sorting nexin-16
MSQRYMQKKHLRTGRNKFKEGNNPHLIKGSQYQHTNHPLRRSASLPSNQFSCLIKNMRSSNRSRSMSDLIIYDNEDPLLNAKSEISLKTIAIRSTGYNIVAPSQQQLRIQRDIINQNMRMMAHRTSVDTSLSSRSFGGQSSQSNSPKENQMFDVVRVPIVGYEVMEERARFTIFKLRIENKATNTNWLVLRRYTDFMRLYGKLKTQFPKSELPNFPRKKWFGNNFSSAFLDNRIQGLQTFINQIINNETLKCSAVIREFFCLDEAPAYSESMEECRVS